MAKATLHSLDEMVLHRQDSPLVLVGRREIHGLEDQ